MLIDENVLNHFRVTRLSFPDRPWVSSVMIASLDSAVDVHGSSGPLGNDTDRALLGLMRLRHGAVFVGASTARNEGYQPSKHPNVRIFIASRNPSEDWSLPLWNDDRTTLVTTSTAGDVPAHVHVIRSGEGELDLLGALATMRADGVEHISCEGGPRINAAFVAADLFDEVSLTVSPFAVGGTVQRALTDTVFDPRQFSLVSHAADGDWLFLRYLRTRAT